MNRFGERPLSAVRAMLGNVAWVGWRDAQKMITELEA